MPRFRLAKIHDNESLAADQTKVINFNTKDAISQLIVQIKALNVDSVADGHPAKIVTKLEIVDGSDVLYSLSGIECQARDFYDNNNLAYNLINYIATSYCGATLRCNFGRWLYDKDLALDLSRYKNPQLKITVDVADAGGSSTAAVQVEVVAHLMEGIQGQPVGYLRNREHFSYTLTANANQYIDLPMEHPIGSLIIMSLADAYQPYQQYNEIEINVDNGAYVPYLEGTSDLIKYLMGYHRPITETLMGVGLAAIANNYVTPTYGCGIGNMAEIQVDKMFGFTQLDSGNIKVDASANVMFTAVVNGWMPHGALMLPFGDQSDPNDWLDLSGSKSLRARIKAGAGAGSIQLLTQQFVKY